MASELFVNERIRARTVRLIENDKMIGVFPLQDALSQARDRGLDLILISGADGPEPICRILNADRYRYERAKAEREAARRQRDLTVDTKEIQLRYATDDNDLSIKAKRARGFLAEGDKVKVVVRFRGRERSRKDEGRKIVAAFLIEVGEYKLERPLSAGESDLIVILAPMVSKSEKMRLKASIPE